MNELRGRAAQRAALLAAALAATACGADDTGSGGAGGTGGAATTSSSSASGSGGAGTAGSGGSSNNGGGGSGGEGGAPSNDPCAGVSDGNHCGGDLGGLADHSSLYVCAGGQTATATPCEAGCESGQCNAVQGDPCASAQFGNGAYCGGSLTGGDPNTLYTCQNGTTAQTTACPNGCQVNPPGTPDNCKAAGNPCSNPPSGNGLYCGSTLNADPNVLYNCQNGSVQTQTVCANGCQENPPGTPDACAPPPGGGTCCLEHPPGVLTQSYTACGSGGSHYGIDYGTANNTPIYAGMSGTVVGSALGFPNCYNNGCSPSCWNAFNYVKLKADCGDPNNPGNDFYIWYLHINDLAPGIQNGVHVNQNQLLALSGNSGCSSGPHIHIETASVAAGSSAPLNTCASVNPATRYCP